MRMNRLILSGLFVGSLPLAAQEAKPGAGPTWPDLQAADIGGSRDRGRPVNASGALDCGDRVV
jgi:hypothetical protein